MSDQEKIAKELISMLLSVKLAVEFNKDKPNKAIRHTLKKVYERAESEQVKAMCADGSRAFYPVGWVSQLDNRIVSDGRYSKEEFLRVGASL